MTTTPTEPNQEFDVWNPDTWPDETAAFETELNTETVIPLHTVEVKDFATLTNQIYQGKYPGELGFNEVLRIVYALREQCFADNNTERYTAGTDEVRYAVAKSMGYTHQVFVNRLKAYVKDQDSQRAAEAERLNQKSGFKRDAKGNILNILHNAEVALLTHPKISKRFRYNTFSSLIEDRETELTITDVTILQTTIEVQKMPGCSFGKDLIANAIQTVADKNKYDPVADWLNSLAWDGTDRLSKAGARYWGTKREIENSFIRKFLISAVARVIEPGCKVDTVPVFEGKQGAGKSTALRILTPEAKYFVDHLPPIDKWDAKLALRTKLIVELSELSSVRGKAVEHLKSFFSTQIDTGRDPYGQTMRDVARTNVFAGTTNSDQYLNDSTGNRRYWPIKVGTIDAPALLKDRDQLWAQALHEYRAAREAGADCIWWLTPEEEKLQSALASDKLEYTITDELVDKWLDGYRYVAGAGMIMDEDPSVARMRLEGRRRDEVSSLEAAVGIGMDPAKIGRVQEMAVGESLRKFGYKSGSVYDKVLKKTVRKYCQLKE